MKRLLARVFGRERKAVAFDQALLDVLVGAESESGQVVTPETALKVTAVLRCALVIADSVATVPLKIMRTAQGRRQAATDHPLYDLLHTRPNDVQSSLEFRETVALHMVLTGNAFVFINRVRAGRRIAELIPLDPARVRVRRHADRTLTYSVDGEEGSRDYPADAIWHLRGPSVSGWLGIDLVGKAREAIGLAMATETAHAKRFRNGVQVSGVYSVTDPLTPEQYSQLRAYINKSHAGIGSAGGWFLLDRGAKWNPISMSGVDAEHVKTRQFQIEEICRALGVMPIMIGYTDKTATYASAEQMFLAHAVHTARPWHRRFEQSIACQLLTAEERAGGYYPKFFDAELLRGAAKDRAEYYMRGIQAGWLLRNEAREFEDMDPIEGLGTPLTPVNMAIGTDGAPARQKEQPSDGT